MESQFDIALHTLHSTKSSGDEQLLSDTLMALDITSIEADGWPAGFFDGLSKLLEDPDFLRLKNSWSLLHFINHNWEYVSSEDRDHLKGVLERSFDRFEEWTGAFLTSEMLGEHFQDSGTLEIFLRLGKTARLPAQAAVPHGLETLARNTSVSALRAQAVHQLKELQKSGPEEVRKEAEISLKKIGTQETPA